MRFGSSHFKKLCFDRALYKFLVILPLLFPIGIGDSTIQFVQNRESEAVPAKTMGKKGVKRGRQTAVEKEPSPPLRNNENPSNDAHNKGLEDQKQVKRGRPRRLKKEACPVMENEKIGENDVERQIVAIQAICDAQIEHVVTQLRVARSMFSNEQLNMPLLQFLKEYCPNTLAIKNSEGIIEFERKNQNYDVDGSHVGEEEWQKSLRRQGSNEQQSVSADDQTVVMPTPVGFHFTSSAVKEKFLRSIGIHVSNLVKISLKTELYFLLTFDFNTRTFHSSQAFEENSEIKIVHRESSFQTPNADGKTSSSVGITPKTRRLPKQGEMLLSVHGSPLGEYCEDRMDTISEADKEP